MFCASKRLKSTINKNNLRYAGDKKETGTVQFTLNGKIVEIPPYLLHPDRSLLSYLRERGLTGAKEVCSEGGCGACLCIISHDVKSGNDKTHVAATSCLLPVPFIHNKCITTIEGVSKNVGDKIIPHPLQEAFLEFNATQCGYCTPGMIVALVAHLMMNPRSTMAELESALDGNLCRCTGYRPIFTASKYMAIDFEPQTAHEKERYEYYQKNLAAWHYNIKYGKPAESLDIHGINSRWHQPISLREVLELRSQAAASNRNSTLFSGSQSFPWEENGMAVQNISKICSGYTDVGFEEKYHEHHYPMFVGLSQVQELLNCEWTAKGLNIGASVTINNAAREMEAGIKKYPAEQTKFFKTFIKHIEFFANSQVRDKASIAGGLMTGHHVSDMVALIVSFNATLEFQSLEAPGSSKIVSRMVEAKDYIVNGMPFLKPDEILARVHIPFTTKNDFTDSYKVGRRRHDSPAIVNNGNYTKFDDNGNVVEIRLVFGGLGRPGIRMTKTENYLLGKQWTDANYEKAASIMKEELNEKVLVNFKVEHKKTLALSFFFKYFNVVKGQRNPSSIDSRNQSLIAQDNGASFTHDGKQDFVEQPTLVGAAIPNQTCMPNILGTSQYTADKVLSADGLYGQLLMSTIAEGRILSIDVTKAQKIKGFGGYFGYESIVGKTKFGFREDDEEFFPEEIISYYGQPIGIVVAETKAIAKLAREAIKVTYAPLHPKHGSHIGAGPGEIPPPSCLLPEDAVKNNSFFGTPREVVRGDPDAALKRSKLVIEGNVDVQGQHCFYFEPQNCIVIPKGNHYEVLSSTQSPSFVQMNVADVLGLPRNSVSVRVERVGGGFGGKQNRSGPVAAMAAVAAQKTGRPVKLEFSRVEDMAWAPSRGPFYARYKAGFSQDGQIECFDISFAVDGGASRDYSHDITETSLFLMDNGYNVPNARIHGKTLKTNKGSFTSTRGFGKPESSGVVEKIMEHAAFELNMDPAELRTKNLYKKGDVTLSSQLITDEDVLRKCWTQAYTHYKELKKGVDEFNKNNKWKKRGIGMVPSKGNMGFMESNDINRGLAMIHIEKDGTVVLSHCGAEMGQGLHTRMMQVCAYELGIPIENVIIPETSTYFVANTPPTTMASTDIVGAAIVNACAKFNNAVADIRKQFPSYDFVQVVNEAYERGIELTQTGLHTCPRLSYDYEKQQGKASYFFVWGSGLSTIELDVLTGYMTILRTDIVQDCGISLNPNLDIGQAEGGFVYGLGAYMFEDMNYNAQGALLTENVYRYKLPAADDIPREFNVKLLRDTPCEEGIHNSKGIGEANVQTALSVYGALRYALKSAREEFGNFDNFDLEFPAGPENIRKCIPDPYNMFKKTQYQPRDWLL